MHESQYMTNSFARIPVRDSLTNLRKKNVGCKVLQFIHTMKIKKHLVTKP